MKCTGEELCEARGYHRWTRVAGPGYNNTKIYRCQDCLAETDKMLLEEEE